MGDSTTYEGTAHMGCFAGINCASMHPPCGGLETFAPLMGRERSTVLVGLIERAAYGDTAAMRSMFKEFPGFVSLNKARSTLQVRGCRKDVIVSSIPITALHWRVLNAL